jgi:hypothetical protein
LGYERAQFEGSWLVLPHNLAPSQWRTLIRKVSHGGSYSVNDVGPGDRSYLGGESDFTALMTVVREIPNRAAIRAFGTPSAASLLISSQSSKVITLQSLSAHFSSPKLFSFRAPPTMIFAVKVRFEIPGSGSYTSVS